MVTNVSTKRWTITSYQNSTSLSAFGSVFLKIFEEPTSVDVRVVLLVGYDKTMYTRINEKIDSHITEI